MPTCASPPTPTPMTRLLNHVRHNAVAYVALFVALGGTGYAAIGLPAGSVGARQLRNGSVMPVKLDRRYMGGYVRAWVSVNAQGHVIASSPGVEAKPQEIGSGLSVVVWHQRATSRCEVLASQILPIGPSAPDAAGPIAARVDFFRRSGEVSVIQTFDAQGQPAPLPYDLALLCSTPR
jgi:hypothetical protein